MLSSRFWRKVQRRGEQLQAIVQRNVMTRGDHKTSPEINYALPETLVETLHCNVSTFIFGDVYTNLLFVMNIMFG